MEKVHVRPLLKGVANLKLEFTELLQCSACVLFISVRKTVEKNFEQLIQNQLLNEQLVLCIDRSSINQLLVY